MKSNSLLMKIPRPSFSKGGVYCMFLIISLLLVSCVSTIKETREATIAVWDIEDLSPSTSIRPDLGELLSGRIIETLSNREYTVIERERLLLALQELNLGTTALVDEATRLKLGKLMGARFMVFGGYQIIGGQMRLDLRMVEVETGKVLKAVQKTTAAGDLSGWIEMAGKAAEEL